MKSGNVRIRNQTCGMLGEGSLQKEWKGSRYKGSAMGRDLAYWGKSKETGVTA